LALTLGLALGTGAAGTSAAAAASTSHATNWTIRAGTLVCGIADVYGTQIDAGTGAPLNGPWPGLQCSVERIPRAPGSKVGDPFVQLGQGRAGRAKVVNLSQDDLLYHRAPVTLAAGTTWSRNGITCEVRSSSIACHNSSSHGFTLSRSRVGLHWRVRHAIS
jgi:hypothetical protein